jgi:hypothetical protein
MGLAALAAVLAVGSGCAASEGPREKEADRVARVVADAISYPRQSDADGFVRAAHAVSAGRDGRLTVVAKEGVSGHGGDDAIARLTFRVYFPAADEGWDHVPELVRCYRVDFSRYGVKDGFPRSTDCPTRTTWVQVAPAPLRQRTPVGTIDVVRHQLRRAPAVVGADQLRTSILAALPAQPTRTLRPEVRVVVDGHDVGVAVRDESGCLFAARLAGSVQAWVLSPAQAQPGEISCTPDGALARLGTHPPH